MQDLLPSAALVSFLTKRPWIREQNQDKCRVFFALRKAFVCLDNKTKSLIFAGRHRIDFVLFYS
jgi:hypothetical protein